MLSSVKLTRRILIVCLLTTEKSLSYVDIWPNSLFPSLISNALELISLTKASRTSNHPLSTLNHAFVTSWPLLVFLIHLIRMSLFDTEPFLILIFARCLIFAVACRASWYEKGVKTYQDFEHYSYQTPSVVESLPLRVCSTLLCKIANARGVEALRTA